MPEMTVAHYAAVDVAAQTALVDGYAPDYETLKEVSAVLRALADKRVTLVPTGDADFVNGFAREAADHAKKVGRRREAERFRTIAVLVSRWLSTPTEETRP